MTPGPQDKGPVPGGPAAPGDRLAGAAGEGLAGAAGRGAGARPARDFGAGSPGDAGGREYPPAGEGTAGHPGDGIAATAERASLSGSGGAEPGAAGAAAPARLVGPSGGRAVTQRRRRGRKASQLVAGSTPLARLPVAVPIVAASSLAMWVPAAYSASRGDWWLAQIFFQSGLLSLVLTGLVALALWSRAARHGMRQQLLTLTGTCLLLPVLLAVPFHIATPGSSFTVAWFEMVSSLTTTGASLYQDPGVLAPGLHLWRALVGWMGGFFVWVMAAAIFQPLHLGGYEVLGGQTSGGAGPVLPLRSADPVGRLLWLTRDLAGVYAGLTAVLWLALVIAGDPALIGLCHAMGTLSTSGISPITGGLAGAPSGRLGEALVLCFLVFALSRRTFAPAEAGDGLHGLWRDVELRLGLLIIGGVSVLLVLRHWLGDIVAPGAGSTLEALRNFWGTLFSSASFLTTTGFVSADWMSAPGWSGLATPGVILMGLAVFGGGVATAAGGVKLLRVYAMWRYGLQSLDKLIEPRRVAGGGPMLRHLHGRGGEVAWVFFMLFALSTGGVMLALTLTGMSLDAALVFAIAAQSTTGGLAQVALDQPLSWAALSPAAQGILAVAMVLGRVETLAVIALFNPAVWQK